MDIASRRRAPRAQYHVARIVADMTLRGWNSRRLARRAGVSDETIYRFMRGDHQTAKTAAAIARALGYSIRRYFAGVVEAA